MSEKYGVLLVQWAYSEESTAKSKLSKLLETWSLLEAKENFDEDLVPATDVPGYLVSSLESKRGFFVPVNLVRVSPKANQREFLEVLAADIQVRKSFEVCLSGSGTFLGATESIGDIDFAEYFLPPHEEVVLGLRELAGNRSYPSLSIDWVQTYFPPNRKRRPLYNRFGDLRRTELAINAYGWKKLQVGASADLSDHYLEANEITNMVLPASAPSSTSPHSNVYQEVVMVEEGKRPPRSLTDNGQISGYFEFLIKEARIKLAFSLEHNCIQTAAKALKRAISLIMLLSDRLLFSRGLALLPSAPNQALELEVVAGYIEDVLEVARKVRTKKGTIDRNAHA